MIRVNPDICALHQLFRIFLAVQEQIAVRLVIRRFCCLISRTNHIMCMRVCLFKWLNLEVMLKSSSSQISERQLSHYIYVFFDKEKAMAVNIPRLSYSLCLSIEPSLGKHVSRGDLIKNSRTFLLYSQGTSAWGTCAASFKMTKSALSPRLLQRREREFQV